MFAGTRVPVDTMNEYLEAGDTLDDFLRQFPTVTREQAVAVLESARRGTEKTAISARRLSSTNESRRVEAWPVPERIAGD